MNVCLKFLKFNFWFLLILFHCHCASLTDRYQYLRVVPETEETQIFLGEQFLDQGTSSLRLKRERKPKLRYETPQNSKTEKLETSYRWGQSFAGNAFLLIYAPIGWVTDFITGAAWEIKEPPPKNKSKFVLNENSKILILPPEMDTELESYNLGRLVETLVIEKYGTSRTIPFVDSFKKSVRLGYDYEYNYNFKKPIPMADLLFDSKATHFIVVKNNKIKSQIDVTLISPYSQEIIEHWSIPQPPDDKDQSQYRWLAEGAVSLIPNTVSLAAESVTYSGCSYYLTVPAYCPQSGRSGALGILSAIKLTHILHYKKRTPWRIYLRFYPDFNLSFKEIEFSKVSPELPDLFLDWYFLNVGYGARLSGTLPFGELFIEATPFWTLNYLRLHSANTDSTQWSGKIAFALQLGFNTWISQVTNLRFYTQAQSLNLNIPGASSVNPLLDFTGSITTLTSGISIGYYFYEEKMKIFDYFK